MSTPDVGVIAGTPNTGLDNNSLFIRDVDPMMYFYEGDKHPFATKILTMGQTFGYRDNDKIPSVSGKSLKTRGRTNYKVEHFEDQVNLADYYKCTAALATGDTALTVSAANDDHFVAGDVLLLTNASGQREVTIIASVATNTLNITDLDGGARTAGIVMTTADKFYKMHNSRAEDSTSQAIRTTKAAEIYNYLEITSEPYGLTQTRLATKDYKGQDPMNYEYRLAVSRLMDKLEKMFWFGERSVAASTTNPVYHNGGYFYWLEAYSDVEIRDMAGFALTKAELLSFLGSVGRGGSTEKWLVGGLRGLTPIYNMGFEFIQLDNFKIGEFGVTVEKIRTVNGIYHLVYEPLFDTIDTFAGSLCVVDPANLQFNFLKKFNSNNQAFMDRPQLLADGATAVKREIIGQVGWTFETLKTMGWLKNIGN